MGELLQYNYSPFCGLPNQVVWDLIISQVHPSYQLSHCCFFLMSLDVEYLFGRFQSFLLMVCSAVSCDFGVLVRGGELKVLLLHHLVSHPYILPSLIA